MTTEKVGKYTKISLDATTVTNAAGKEVALPARAEFQTAVKLLKIGTWNEKLVNMNGVKFIVNQIEFPLPNGKTINTTALCYERNYDPEQRREDKNGNVDRSPLTEGNSYLCTFTFDPAPDGKGVQPNVRMSHLSSGNRLTIEDFGAMFADAHGIEFPTSAINIEDESALEKAAANASEGAPVA